MSEVIHLASAVGYGRPRVPISHPAIRTDTVYAIYTSCDDTLAAVRVAADVARALRVPVMLVHLRMVSYAVPMNETSGISPVETDAFIARLRAENLDARVRVFLCREKHRAAMLAFKPHSLIVLAGRRSWWPTESERWRRILEGAGHFVVFVDKSEHKERLHA